MSEPTATEEPRPVKKALRTVTPGPKTRPDAEMNSIGWAVFLGVLVLLVPMLPFIAVAWLVSKGIELARRQVG